jgi:hypothetical protein
MKVRVTIPLFVLIVLLVSCSSPPEFPSTPVPTIAATDSWTSIGPWGAFVNALVVDPLTPTTLYAGASRGGAFKSSDSGGT